MSSAMIWCQDLLGNIGRQGGLLDHVPEDLQRFKSLTNNRVVVMGRKTYESLPKHNRPLPNRFNVVISSEPEKIYIPHHEGFVIDKPVELAEFESTLSDSFNGVRSDKTWLEGPPESVFVIGGATLYKHYLDQVDTIYITLLHTIFSADTRLHESCMPDELRKKGFTSRMVKSLEKGPGRDYTISFSIFKKT